MVFSHLLTPLPIPDHNYIRIDFCAAWLNNSLLTPTLIADNVVTVF
jgi:hypothetical protein